MTVTGFGLGSIGFSAAVGEGGFGITGTRNRRSTLFLEDRPLLLWQ
jgi:hypothetical protein